MRKFFLYDQNGCHLGTSPTHDEAQEEGLHKSALGSSERASSRLFVLVFFAVASLVFVATALDFVNKAQDLAREDTGSYLEGALFIKEHGGVANFLPLCVQGSYKIVVQHPLYLLILSTFASRDLSFFTYAKIASLGVGLLVVIAFFFIAHNLFGKAVATLTSVLLIFNTAFLTESSQVACETLLILFLSLSWYFMVKGTENQRYWAWAGLASGFAYLTKGTGLLTVPIFVISSVLIFKLSIARNKWFWSFFLLFVVSSSPLILRNLIVYQSPFYEGINSHTIWLDRYEELADPQYRLLVDWREHTHLATGGLPNLSSYIRTHSFDEIVRRAVSGLRGEAVLLLNSLQVHGLPTRGKTFSLMLFGFFLVGILRDNGRRSIFTFVTMLGFILPFSWYFQIIPEVRFITPLLPLTIIYAAFGCVELLRLTNDALATRYPRFNPILVIPHVVTACLVLAAGYLATTKTSLPLIRFATLSEDQRELSDWLKNSTRETDVVILGPTRRYWGLFWHAGFQGKLAPTVGNLRSDADDISDYQAILRQKRVNIVIIHKENYFSPEVLKEYFTYDQFYGLRQKQSIDGWRLLYESSQKPVHFLIYRLDGNGVEEAAPLWVG